jgi:hypothetical protein
MVLLGPAFFVCRLCSATNELCRLFIRWPDNPGDYGQQLERRRRPERPGNAKRAVREESAEDSSNDEHDGRAHPSVSFGVVQSKQVRVGEEIAVYARQDDTGEAVILQGSASDGLAAALEGDQGDGHEDVPAYLLLGLNRGTKCHDRGCNHCEQHLEQERGAEYPSALWREVSVEAAEEEGAETEAAQRGTRLDPSRRLSWSS